MHRLPRLFPVLLLLVLALPARADMFGAQSFTLDNGMEVVVIPDHRAPVVTQMVWYRVGSADETAGKNGLAHFLEHLMFKGTENMPDGEFSYIVARNGGTENAFTSYDYTAYFQNVAADRLELVMELEAERMTGLVMSDEDVETERQVILEERRMRTDNNPSAILAEQVRAAQYYIHPYGWPVIGWNHEILGLTHQDVVDFYRAHYAPNNAILVIAGDVTLEEVRPLAERIYGAIPAVELTPRERAADPPQSAARRVVMEDPRAAQPSIQLSYMAPTHVTGPSEQAYALEALAQVLSGSTTSRLYRDLVVDQGVAATAGAWYDSDAVDPSRFGFWIVPADGRTAEEAEAALRAAIADLLAEGITEVELERAKSRMAADLIYARDSVSSIARWYGASLAVGLTIEEIEAWPERIAAVTVEQVNAAARAVFVPQTEVTGVLLPQGDDDV
ncbi:MAG: pitrilysin family protein [Proteobacteria bacterium]|nr:pitrilysin family protein [Pseudomonadota bacterium]MDA0951640.1 pitrilysin family protein [Pseudomonadota bacterium]MDA1070839.1 pitrilysin family protein [Pseudomonadota bacterium]